MFSDLLPMNNFINSLKARILWWTDLLQHLIASLDDSLRPYLHSTLS